MGLVNYDFTKYQMPNDNRVNKVNNKLPISSVDILADELVAEYNNPEYRRWYCAVIYEFQPEKVLEWRRRAKEGSQPGRLFSRYVSEARKFKKA